MCCVRRSGDLACTKEAGFLASGQGCLKLLGYAVGSALGHTQSKGGGVQAWPGRLAPLIDHQTVNKSFNSLSLSQSFNFLCLHLVANVPLPTKLDPKVVSNSARMAVPTVPCTATAAFCSKRSGYSWCLFLRHWH